MVINCTKKLQEELKIAPEKAVISDPLYSWHGHCIRINRRKTVVLVNDASRYQVVLHGLKAKDFKDFTQLALAGIRAVMLADCVNPRLIDAYLDGIVQVTYSKSQSNKQVSWVNKGCEIVQRWEDAFLPDTMVQSNLSHRASHYPITMEGHQYTYPSKLFYTHLIQRFDFPLFHCQAVVLNTQLDMEHFEIRRRVVVPLNHSFAQLHKTMQKLYGWQNEHLHDFMIADGTKPVAYLAEDAEMFQEEMPVKQQLEASVLLSDYVVKYKNWLYTYDFGVDWVHKIVVERVLLDYDKNHPICLDGTGDAPLDGVGGEYGHASFLNIKANSNHPEYQAAKVWASYHWDDVFDLDAINRDLQYLY